MTERLQEIKNKTVWSGNEGTNHYSPSLLSVEDYNWLILQAEKLANTEAKIQELENWKLKYIKQVLDKIENHDGIFLVEFSPTVLDDWRKLLKETK